MGLAYLVLHMCINCVRVASCAHSLSLVMGTHLITISCSQMRGRHDQTLYSTLSMVILQAAEVTFIMHKNSIPLVSCMLCYCDVISGALV